MCICGSSCGNPRKNSSNADKMLDSQALNEICEFAVPHKKFGQKSLKVRNSIFSPYKRNNYKLNIIIHIQMHNILFYFIILFLKLQLIDSTMTVGILCCEGAQNQPTIDELDLFLFSNYKNYPRLAGRAHPST